MEQHPSTTKTAVDTTATTSTGETLVAKTHLEAVAILIGQLALSSKSFTNSIISQQNILKSIIEGEEYTNDKKEELYCNLARLLDKHESSITAAVDVFCNNLSVKEFLDDEETSEVCKGITFAFTSKKKLTALIAENAALKEKLAVATNLPRGVMKGVAFGTSSSSSSAPRDHEDEVEANLERASVNRSNLSKSSPTNKRKMDNRIQDENGDDDDDDNEDDDDRNKNRRGNSSSSSKSVASRGKTSSKLESADDSAHDDNDDGGDDGGAGDEIMHDLGNYSSTGNVRKNKRKSRAFKSAPIASNEDEDAGCETEYEPEDETSTDRTKGKKHRYYNTITRAFSTCTKKSKLSKEEQEEFFIKLTILYFKKIFKAILAVPAFKNITNSNATRLTTIFFVTMINPLEKKRVWDLAVLFFESLPEKFTPDFTNNMSNIFERGLEYLMEFPMAGGVNSFEVLHKAWTKNIESGLDANKFPACMFFAQDPVGLLGTVFMSLTKERNFAIGRNLDSQKNFIRTTKGFYDKNVSKAKSPAAGNCRIISTKQNIFKGYPIFHYKHKNGGGSKYVETWNPVTSPNRHIDYSTEFPVVMHADIIGSLIRLMSEFFNNRGITGFDSLFPPTFERAAFDKTCKILKKHIDDIQDATAMHNNNNNSKSNDRKDDEEDEQYSSPPVTPENQKRKGQAKTPGKPAKDFSMNGTSDDESGSDSSLGSDQDEEAESTPSIDRRRHPAAAAAATKTSRIITSVPTTEQEENDKEQEEEEHRSDEDGKETHSGMKVSDHDDDTSEKEAIVVATISTPPEIPDEPVIVAEAEQDVQEPPKKKLKSSSSSSQVTTAADSVDDVASQTAKKSKQQQKTQPEKTPVGTRSKTPKQKNTAASTKVEVVPLKSDNVLQFEGDETVETAKGAEETAVSVAQEEAEDLNDGF